MDVFVLAIVFFALVAASYADIRTREVPDSLSFFLIASGFFIAGIKSLVTLSFSPIFSSILGFGLGFLISAAMFYAGQWGGGDAKVLMGVGATIGLGFSLSDFFVSFLLNTIAVGAVYGLLWGIALGVLNRKKVEDEIKKTLFSKNFVKMQKIGFLILFALLILIIILPLQGFRLPLFLLLIVFFSTFYLWIYVKIIEKVCMVKKVKPHKLTEGDWIIEEVVAGRKVVASKKDLGVSKEQIEELKKLALKGKISAVTIKTGIPFIPSFLFGFLLTYFFGNIFMIFVSI